MEIHTNLRACFTLFLGITFAYLGDKITGSAVFYWIGVIGGVLLFLNLYWLFICLLYHMKYGNRAEETILPIETELLPPDDTDLQSAPLGASNFNQALSE